MPDDRIINRGDWGDEFFIVNQGAVVVLQQDDATPSVVLRDGSYFGELAALLGGKRQHSIVALTHCFLYSLKHDAFESILKKDPAVIDHIINNMCNWYNFDEIQERLVKHAEEQGR